MVTRCGSNRGHTHCHWQRRCCTTWPQSGFHSGHKLFLLAISVGPNFVQQFWFLFGLQFLRRLVGFFLAGGPHFVTIFGPSFGHRFWSLFWAPSCPQIQRLLMNRLFVGQFWHQIWSPKREPKTTNFLPRNPDTFQPNFEQNLTKKSKKLERRKRYCKYPKKRHDHVLQTGSTSWPPSRRLRGILAARKRNTHPPALRVTTMVRHVLELVWVPVSGTYPGLIKLLPSVSHASRWQANATNRKQRAPAQKRDEQSFRWKGADCGICSAIEYAARRIRNASGAESSTGAVPLRAPRALSARGARCVARPTLKLKLEVKLFCETRARALCARRVQRYIAELKESYSRY